MVKRQEEEFGLIAQLRKAIRDSGQSLTQLGKECQVNPSMLSRFMTGQRGLTLGAAERICKVLRLRLTGGSPARKTK